MSASLENPVYSVYLVSGNMKYNLTSILYDLDLNDRDQQIAKSVTMQLVNKKVDGKLLSSIINVDDRVFIYADDGSKKEEVFRGSVWGGVFKSTLEDRMIQLKCFDNLIYFQESEESEYFSSGKSTKSVFSSLCDKWGVKLNYSYRSITHSKLVLRGTLSDIFTDDILELVKERTGKKYVILSIKDVMHVKEIGQNSTVYSFIGDQNTTSASSEVTKDGMVTKVVILGKEDEDERSPVEATIKGNTTKHGTLQKIINRNENTSLADSKKEAQTIIDEDGKPKWEHTVIGVDIPWICKGDKVRVKAGTMDGYFWVKGVNRSINSKRKEMTLTLEDW